MATKTVTAQGSAQLDTSNKEFGSAGAKFDAAGDYLNITANSADFNFGSADFTVDFWWKSKTTSAPADIFDLFNIDKNSVHSAGNYGFEIYVASSLLVVATFSNGTNQYNATAAVNVLDQAWHHIAVIRNGNAFKIFVDGTVGAVTDTISGSQNFDVNMVVEIANRFGGGETALGWIDELRVSKGIARWTSNFTPPVAEYATDGNTVLLLHMNGANTSTVFTDNSALITYTLAMAQGSFTFTGQTIAMKKALSILMAQGSYAISSIATVLSYGKKVSLAMGSFVLTGIDIAFRKGWGYINKNTTNYGNPSKHNTSYSQKGKATTNWGYLNKD